MCDIRVQVMAFLSVVIGIVGIIVALIYTQNDHLLDYNYLLKLFPFESEIASSGDRILTVDELKYYTGEEGSRGLYIAIVGQVYDVSKGSRHYGPGSGYHGFAGRDGSKAFVTGKFDDEGLTDDLSDLPLSSYVGIHEWHTFYDTDYTYVGKLCGTFYDCRTGAQTPALDSYHKKLAEAQEVQAGEKVEDQKFPHCNSQWKQNQGGSVWCAPNSGGIQREWSGLPRLFHVKSTGRTRCACIRDYGPPTDDPEAVDHDNVGDLNDPRLRLYENCDPHSTSCRIPEA